MKVRVLKWVVLATVAFAIIGGSCGPPEYKPCRAPGDRPSGGAPYVEEIASLVRITNRPSHECTPALSPDGKYLAFDAWDPENCYDVSDRNHEAGDFDIWVINAHGGGGYQRVTNNTTDDYYPAWYPDGKRLLFTSERSGHPAIWSRAVDGTNGSQQLSWMGTSDFAGDVDPTGKYIVFSSADRMYREIADIYDQLSSPPFCPAAPRNDPYTWWNARWHPRIYRIDVNGARLTDLGTGLDPQISPDGKRIVYSSMVAGSWDVWIMDINGANKTQITTYPGNETDPCWSPDGRYVAYSKSAPYAKIKYAPNGPLFEEEYWNIWVTSIETGENFQKTFSRWFRDLSPCWGYVDEGDHYRDYIYFHSDRDDYGIRNEYGCDEYISTGFDIYRLDPEMGVAEYDLPDIPKSGGTKVAYSNLIRVLNGTRGTSDVVPGWANRVTEKLTTLGYNCLEPQDTYSETPNYVKVYYRNGAYDLACSVANDLPDVPGITPKLRKMPKNFSWKEEDVVVVLGK